MNDKLKAALDLASKGFRVFPLAPNSKIPPKGFTDFSSKASSEPSVIKEWFGGKADFNIGISTDEFCVIDVDVKVDPKTNKNGFDSLKELSDKGKSLPRTLRQVTPSGGIHYIYKTPRPVKNSIGRLGSGIDVRGHHGFIVGAGSTIDGKPYLLNTELTDSIEEICKWALDGCGAPNEAAPLATTIAATVDPNLAWARGEEYLATLPPSSSGGRNRDAYKAACKLKDIGMNVDDAYALMLEGFRSDPEMEGDELAAVTRSAFKYGKDAQGSASPEAMFGNQNLETDIGIHPIRELNEEYAFLLLGGKHRILWETKDANGNYAPEFLEENTFHAHLASRMFFDGSGNARSLSKLWMGHGNRRTYKGLVFKPEIEVGPEHYNLWRGFSVKEMKPDEPITDAMKKARASFEDHIFENVANQNSEHYKWVMAWFAHLLQKPWEKPMTALTLRGEKGVGKNAIFETFKPLFPAHYLASGDKRYLLSNFNGHLERLLMFVCDEAFWSGDKASEGVLKSLITDPSISIEKKGRESINIQSNHRIAILANEKWVVPASADERRYAVFNMGTKYKQNRAFFGAMDANMKAGGLKYLFTVLRKFDLTGVDVAVAPQTAALLEQKKQSMSTIEQWWDDSLTCGAIANNPSNDMEWPISLSLSQMKSAFIAYARSRGRGAYLDSDTGFMNQIKECANGIEIKKGQDGLYFIFPALLECRNQWDLKLGAKQNWY